VRRSKDRQIVISLGLGFSFLRPDLAHELLAFPERRRNDLEDALLSLLSPYDVSRQGRGLFAFLRV